VGVSFQRAATQILQSLSNAPKAVIRGPVQAGKATFAQAAIFWGCAVKSSGAKLPFGSETCRRAQVESLKAEGPFDGMRQDFAAL